jgi:predicted O-methyltransferase YrrM
MTVPRTAPYGRRACSLAVSMRLSDYYEFSDVLSRLRRASAADVWRWVSTLPALLTAPSPIDSVAALCQVFPGTTQSQALALQDELSSDKSFFCALDCEMQKRRGRTNIRLEWHTFLYSAVRIVRPKVVLETGVFDGVSSSLILRALERNAAGTLVSIDLPAREMITDATDRMREGALPWHCDPGWIVPEGLRERYRLHLGDSKQLLPGLLKEYGQLDIFLHDSLHTYHHQFFEYEVAWPYLAQGGLLLSDDIFWSRAFHRFVSKHKLQYLNAGNFGIVRKPASR